MNRNMSADQVLALVGLCLAVGFPLAQTWYAHYEMKRLMSKGKPTLLSTMIDEGVQDNCGEPFSLSETALVHPPDTNGYAQLIQIRGTRQQGSRRCGIPARTEFSFCSLVREKFRVLWSEKITQAA